MCACLFAHTLSCVFWVARGEQVGEEEWRKWRGSVLRILWLPVSLGPRQRQSRAWGSLVIDMSFGGERQANKWRAEQWGTIWAGHCFLISSPGCILRDSGR